MHPSAIRASVRRETLSPSNSPPISTSPRGLHSSKKTIRLRSERSVAVAAALDHEPMTDLYRHARQHEWDDVAKQCQQHPDDAMYINPIDGTTALHLAVMSRTGYSLEQDCAATDDCVMKPTEPSPAPLEVIEDLLKVNAYASMVVCQINTYTPLAYACLVSGEVCNLEDAAVMVRLLLQYAPGCISIFTAGGLSALDVHIISYSHRQRGNEEDDLLSGRTSTVVLRTLLEAEHSLALVRIHGDKVGGPIELLYRCNSAAFLDAVCQDEDANNRRKKLNDNDKSVIAAITNWWVWKWTVLILKYGTLPHKKKGTRFLTVQAAAGMIGCPLPVLTLAMKAFPKQIRQRDEMHGERGNFPLHDVCTWPCEQDWISSDPIISSRKGMAISALLQEYPDAARIPNHLHQTPLELAVATQTTWDGGVRKLVRACPLAASVPSPTLHLFPFMTAAMATRVSSKCQQPTSSSKRSLMTHMKYIAKRDLQTVRTIYGLLRSEPSVLTRRFCPEEEDEED